MGNKERINREELLLTDLECCTRGCLAAPLIEANTATTCFYSQEADGTLVNARHWMATDIIFRCGREMRCTRVERLGHRSGVHAGNKLKPIISRTQLTFHHHSSCKSEQIGFPLIKQHVSIAEVLILDAPNMIAYAGIRNLGHLTWAMVLLLYHNNKGSPATLPSPT